MPKAEALPRSAASRDFTPLWRRVLRWAGRIVLLLVVVVMAWILSNAVDSPPVPRPPALQIPPPLVPDARNAYFALAGLRAPSGRSPAAAGLAQWRGQATPAELKTVLAMPDGSPYYCDDEANCTAAWLADAPRLAEQLGPHAELGARCEALMVDFAFEERMPARTDSAGMSIGVAQHNSGLATCSRWFNAQATLAAARADDMAAARWVMLADRLNRGALAASRTLAGSNLAWSLARRTWQAAAVLAVAQPALATSLRPVVAPLPAEAGDAARWMVGEAAFGRTMILGMRADCLRPRADHQASWIDQLLCRTGIGLLPQQTVADFDRHWLAAIDATRDGLPAALDRPPIRVDPNATWLHEWAWRNTFGHALTRVAASSYADYVARQIDVDLHRSAVALALAMVRERVPTDQRAAWLAAQPIDDLVRSRLTIDGDTLLARDWSAEHGGAQREQDRIRVPLARF
jgi:hypothetical protein